MDGRRSPFSARAWEPSTHRRPTPIHDGLRLSEVSRRSVGLLAPDVLMPHITHNPLGPNPLNQSDGRASFEDGKFIVGALYINFKLKEDVAFVQPHTNIFLLMTLIST